MHALDAPRSTLTVPPRPNRRARRGGFTSHFELYLDGMRQAGARTDRLETFVHEVERGMPDALAAANVPAPASAFVRTTFDLIPA